MHVNNLPPTLYSRHNCPIEYISIASSIFWFQKFCHSNYNSVCKVLSIYITQILNTNKSIIAGLFTLQTGFKFLNYLNSVSFWKVFPLSLTAVLQTIGNCRRLLTSVLHWIFHLLWPQAFISPYTQLFDYLSTIGRRNK